MNKLVAYSSSSESENEDDAISFIAEKNETREDFRPRLPLPNQIRNLQSKSIHEVPADDPDEHGGRVRSFQHERGNWATYVYIPVNISILDELQRVLSGSIESKLKLKKPEETHISLTRTVVLQHHWIDTFVTSIREELIFFNKFTIDLNSLKVYCNEERTRTFIGLRVDDGAAKFLENISKRLDSILKEYRLAPFYQDPSFHCSILWCIGDCEETLNDNLSVLEVILQRYLDDYSRDMQMNVNAIYCKTGNKLFHIDLS